MKRSYLIAIAIILAFVTFSAMERISFFKSKPLLKGKSVKVVNGLAETEDVLAAKCKGDRGENEVLEIVRNDNVSHARCGMFWPFTDTYVMSAETLR